MIQKNINTFQNKLRIVVGRGVSRLMGIGLFPALLLCVFFPVSVESTAFSRRQMAPELQHRYLMLGNPVAWHADFLAIVASHIRDSGMKDIPELEGGSIKVSRSVSPNGQTVANEIADESKHNRTPWCIKYIQEQFPNEPLACLLITHALFGVGGIALGMVITYIYEWCRWNLTNKLLSGGPPAEQAHDAGDGPAG